MSYMKQRWLELEQERAEAEMKRTGASAIIHDIKRPIDSWHASQPYAHPHEKYGTRCVEIRDRASGELLETFAPPQDWRRWSWNVTPNGDGIAFFNK